MSVHVGRAHGVYLAGVYGPVVQNEGNLRVFQTALDDLPSRARTLIEHIRRTHPAPAPPPLPEAINVATLAPKYRGTGSISLVLLRSSGWSAIGQKLKEFLGCDLYDAHRVMAGVPIILMRTNSIEEAESVRAELEAAGGIIEFRYPSPLSGGA